MRGAILQFLSGLLSLNITVSNLGSSKNLDIQGDYSAGQIPQIDPADVTKLRFIDPGTLGGGSVSSVTPGANATAILDIANSTTTPTISFDNQNINLVFAGPSSGGAGAPTFRALVAADLPNHDASLITSGTLAFTRLPVGTTANTIAAGNDSRFHTQGTDTGTTAGSFQINSGSNGVRLRDDTGALRLRNAADNADADLIVRNLVVQGTTTTINTETVDIVDNILNINSNVTTGSPTENAGLRVSRGASTAASLLWNESTDRWQIGLEGAEFDSARIREFTFTSTNVTSGIVTIAHNMGRQRVHFTCYESTGQVFHPLINIPATDVNNLSLNIGSLTISGTATVVISG